MDVSAASFVTSGARSLASWAAPRTSRVDPRMDTSGDIPPPRSQAQVDSLCNQGAMSGAIQGLVSGAQLGGWQAGVAGASAGAIGGLVGSKIGFKFQSLPLALSAGAATGAVTCAAMGWALSALTGAPLSSTSLAAGSLMGGLTGLVGTLGSSRRSATRDSVYGGYTTGLIARTMTGNPLAGLASAAGAGWAARQENVAARVGIAALGGAAVGALTALPFFVAGHPQAMQMLTQGAIAGGVSAPAGVLLGPVVRQATRNGQDAMVGSINQKLDPWLDKHPLPDSGKVAAGAALGVLATGTFGMLAPALGLPLLPSLAVTSALGATLGGGKVAGILRTQKKAKVAEAMLQTYVPAGAGLGNVLAHRQAQR